MRKVFLELPGKVRQEAPELGDEYTITITRPDGFACTDDGARLVLVDACARDRADGDGPGCPSSSSWRPAVRCACWNDDQMNAWRRRDSPRRRDGALPLPAAHRLGGQSAQRAVTVDGNGLVNRCDNQGCGNQRCCNQGNGR